MYVRHESHLLRVEQAPPTLDTTELLVLRRRHECRSGSELHDTTRTFHSSSKNCNVPVSIMPKCKGLFINLEEEVAGVVGVRLADEVVKEDLQAMSARSSDSSHIFLLVYLEISHRRIAGTVVGIALVRRFLDVRSAYALINTRA